MKIAFLFNNIEYTYLEFLPLVEIVAGFLFAIGQFLSSISISANEHSLDTGYKPASVCMMI